MDKEIKALKAELALMKLQFSERAKTLEIKINTLEGETSVVDEDVSAPVSNSSNLSANSSMSPVTTEAFLSTLTNADRLANTPTSPTNSPNDVLSEPSSEKRKQAPAFFIVFFQSLFSSAFDWLSPIQKIYHSYKERDMLGIFILTLVGIALTVAGFGYLMQLLIDQLGAGAKSLLMGTAAISVMALGVGLKIKTRYGEFATAIVTLGILLSYSTVFFSGSVYSLLPSILVSVLYLIIALLCHFIALRLDTKIVAGLGIIGVATMPLLSDTLQIDPLTYGLSLLFVTASSLVIAYRKIGQWLANLNLVFVVVALEWTMAVTNVETTSWMINVFYLLFFSYTAFSIINNKQAQKVSLIFLAVLLGSTLLLFLQADFITPTAMSISFFINTLLAIGVSFVLYKLKQSQTHFLILLSALWGVLTIISLLGSAYWGIAWAAEGLLLFYIGRNYHLPNVIHQGQVLTSLALLYSWAALAQYFPLPVLQSVDGWIMSLVIVAVLGLWQRMINKSSKFDSFTVNMVKPILMLLECVWLSVLLIGCSVVWLGDWTGGTVVLIQLALLLRAKQCKQTSIEIFAALLILIPIAYVVYGALTVHTFRFMLLPAFAKLALISAFLQLWLWSEFYRQLYPESKMKRIAERIRIVFYMLIPICWLSSAIRRLDENILMILWLSPALALLFAEKVKHPLLIIEAKVLTLLSSISLVFLISWLKPSLALVALLGFTGFYFAAFFINKATNKEINTKSNAKTTNNSLHLFICSCGFTALGLALPHLVGAAADSLLYAMLMASVYWVLAFMGMAHSDHLQRNKKVITLVNAFIIVSAWVFTIQNAWFACLPAIFIVAAVIENKRQGHHASFYKLLNDKSDLALHLLVALTYTLLLISLQALRLDLLIAPMLAVHGALILFMKDKRLITVKFCFTLMALGILKLALIDAANALLWQKVILFMGIGLFILMAAFWYQRLINKAKLVGDITEQTLPVEAIK